MAYIRYAPGGEWTGADINNGKIQIDMPVDPAHYDYTDEHQSYWINLADWVGGVIGDANFTDLNDTPASYSGQALKIVRVNATATGLEFVDTVNNEMTITTFTDSIILDKLLGRDYGLFDVTSSLKVLLDETGIKDGAYAQLAAIGDGTNNLDLSNFNKSDENGLDYLNTTNFCNAIIFYRYMKKNYYTIIDQYLCSTPTLLSTYTSANGAIVYLQFSRTMANPSAQAALFTLSPEKTISSVTLKEDDKTIIQLNLASNYTAANTILITIASGLMPEGIGDEYIGVTDQPVTNNVAPVYVSWTSLVNETLDGNTATCNSATGSAQGGTLSKTHGNYVQMVIITPKADSYASVLILDDDNTDNNWGAPYGSHGVFNQVGGTYVVEGSTLTAVATNSSENTILRLELSLESGTWYVLTKRSTNGVDWTEIRKTALSITGTIYIKHIIATTGSKVYNATINNV